MDISILLPFFEQYGLPGLAIVLLFWMLYKKELRVNQLTDKLVEKNEADTERFVGVARTLEKLVMLVEGGK